MTPIKLKIKLMLKRNLFVFTVLLSLSSPARAAEGRQFFMSVIYGTLAGTLVGAASLAFTTSPGDNLNNVSRGASYGLYAGILLGLYVTYVLEDEPPPNGYQQPQSRYKTPSHYNDQSGLKISFVPYIAPSPAKKDLEVGAQVLTYRF